MTVQELRILLEFLFSWMRFYVRISSSWMRSYEFYNCVVLLRASWVCCQVFKLICFKLVHLRLINIVSFSSEVDKYSELFIRGWSILWAFHLRLIIIVSFSSEVDKYCELWDLPSKLLILGLQTLLWASFWFRTSMPSVQFYVDRNIHPIYNSGNVSNGRFGKTFWIG